MQTKKEPKAMKPFQIMIALAAAAVAGGALAQDSIDLGDAPMLRAGYWETLSIEQGSKGEKRTKVFMCVDDAMQERMKVLTQGGMCSELRIEPQRSKRWAFRSVCNPGGMGRMVSEGTISGDLHERFQSETVTTGSFMGRSMNSKSTQDGRHVGACPDGIVPGDLVMADGSKFNVMQMAAGAGGSILGQLGGLLGGGGEGGSQNLGKALDRLLGK